MYGCVTYMINIATIWGLIILFLLQPGIAHDGAEAGARLFVQALLPYLLPYIILTQWLLKTNAINNRKSLWKKYIKAYVLGSFGGFPVGAVTVSAMRKNNEFSRKQSELLLAACHAPGPMFIIGFVGTELFGDVSAGWKLLIAIHVANILFFLIIITFSPQNNDLEQAITLPNDQTKSMPFLDAVKESSNIIILVATTVIFFSALGTVLSQSTATISPVDLNITQTIVFSFLEMTSGVQTATINFSDFPLFPIVIAAIISMNGLSIHMQVAVISKSADIPMRLYIIGRLWSIVFVPFLFYLIL